MAVFPGFISLKNSTDPEAVIVTAIETGGTDEINQGELVIGLSAGDATLFTKDSLGDIVTISGSGGGTGVVYWGGGDFTTGTSDGQAADGGVFT